MENRKIRKDTLLMMLRLNRPCKFDIVCGEDCCLKCKDLLKCYHRYKKWNGLCKNGTTFCLSVEELLDKALGRKENEKANSKRRTD